MKRLAIGMAALLQVAAFAGEFSVSPVRIFMTARDRAVAVTVVNEGAEDLVVQSEIFSWGQKPDGTDDLRPTEDVVLSPPIVTLAPRTRQVLRLARVAPPIPGEEQHYRLIVREVPEALQGLDRKPKVQMALAFSLPIFITPPGAKRDVRCDLSRGGAMALRVVCANKGTAYAQVRGVSLASGSGALLSAHDVVGYILPDRQRTFEVVPTARIPGGQVKLNVSFDDGTTQSFDAAVPE